MCGIVGAILAQGTVLQGMIEGLRVLEYRGYDSAGVAVASGEGVRVTKRAGRLEMLENALLEAGMPETRVGIGHTRWATHGPPTDQNAHPHTDGSGELALVHNGIIENYLELREELAGAGASFTSDTDTEVLAHLIGRELEAGGTLAEATSRALGRVRGYFAIALLRDGPEPELVCARRGPPLCVGVARQGTWLASDVLALIPHTRDVIYLEDGDLAELTPEGVVITGEDGRSIEREVQRVEWDPTDAGKGTWPHYMLKEIHEQPDVLARTAFHRIDEDQGDVHFDEEGWEDEALTGISRIQVIACGTALHAGMIARYLIEGLARIPVSIDFASEYRYREPVIIPGTLALGISQSGETADSLAALRMARERGARVACICNVAGSTMVREADAVLMTQAGPEIGVASTKAFVAQVIAAYLLAVRLGRARDVIDLECGQMLVKELRRIRPSLEQLLSDEVTTRIREIADRQKAVRGFLFLGRGVNYPIALEGALKLKEISYMHAEGYAAGEMKHGPIAMIDEWMTAVVIAGHGALAEKVRANIEQVKARGGQVIGVGSDSASLAMANDAIEVPPSSLWLSPILNVLPLQLLAYEIARLRGCDIDKPRNLAKSVTVE